MYVFISLLRAVCTLVLLVHKKRSVSAQKENTGLYQESAPILLMVNQCLSLDLSGDGEQGCRSSESTHLPPMRPGSSIPASCHMCVEFVVGFRLAQRDSPGFRQVFLPPQNPWTKTN